MKSFLLVIALVVWCGLTFSAGAQSPRANWLTDGDVQRSGWRRNETTLTTANVKDRNPLEAGPTPREMHAAAAARRRRSAAAGPKEIAIVADSSDNLYAIDVRARRYSGRNIQYPPAKTSRRPRRAVSGVRPPRR
jgi:hypothetical protein